MIGIVQGCHEQQDYIDWLNHFGFNDIKIIWQKERLKIDKPSIVIFCGGADLGKRKERDKIEKEVYTECKKLGIPMLCICRGMQLSAMLEGAEIVDIDGALNESHVTDEQKNSKWHNITLSNGKVFEVNSRHHQRVFYLPFLYHAVGYDDNGIPEYAEENDKLLIQCHPEKQEMWDKPFEKIVIDFISKFEKI